MSHRFPLQEVVMKGTAMWLKERIRRWWSGRPSAKPGAEPNKKPSTTGASPEATSLQRWEDEGGAPVDTRLRPGTTFEATKGE
jgi:hypothetical protein